MADLRPAVIELVDIGPMPTTSGADEHPVLADRWEALLGEIYAAGEVTDHEASALLPLFPSDDSDCYGIAWTLVHVIEAAPGWPLAQDLGAATGPWADLLRQRLRPS